MSEQQKEAVAVFDQIASSDELRLDWVLQPGDIQLLHNHQIVHTRSEYEDFEVGFTFSAWSHYRTCMTISCCDRQILRLHAANQPKFGTYIFEAHTCKVPGCFHDCSSLSGRLHGSDDVHIMLMHMAIELQRQLSVILTALFSCLKALRQDRGNCIG